MPIFKSNQMSSKKMFFMGAANALGVLLYVSLVAWFMNNAEKFIGQKHGILGPMIFLMVFVFSALVTGSLVLGRPVILYLDGKKAEAVKMLFFTAVSLFILLLLAIGGLGLQRS